MRCRPAAVAVGCFAVNAVVAVQVAIVHIPVHHFPIYRDVSVIVVHINGVAPHETAAAADPAATAVPAMVEHAAAPMKVVDQPRADR